MSNILKFIMMLQGGLALQGKKKGKGRTSADQPASKPPPPTEPEPEPQRPDYHVEAAPQSSPPPTAIFEHPQLPPLKDMITRFAQREKIDAIHPDLFCAVVKSDIRKILQIERDLQKVDNSLGRETRKDGLLHLALLVGDVDVFFYLCQLEPCKVNHSVQILDPIEGVQLRYGGDVLQLAVHLRRVEMIEYILSFDAVDPISALFVSPFPSEAFGFYYPDPSALELAIINDDLSSVKTITEKPCFAQIPARRQHYLQGGGNVFAVAAENKSVRVFHYLLEKYETTEFSLTLVR